MYRSIVIITRECDIECVYTFDSIGEANKFSDLVMLYETQGYYATVLTPDNDIWELEDAIQDFKDSFGLEDEA